MKSTKIIIVTCILSFIIVSLSSSGALATTAHSNQNLKPTQANAIGIDYINETRTALYTNGLFDYLNLTVHIKDNVTDGLGLNFSFYGLSSNGINKSLMVWGAANQSTTVLGDNVVSLSFTGYDILTYGHNSTKFLLSMNLVLRQNTTTFTEVKNYTTQSYAIGSWNPVLIAPGYNVSPIQKTTTISLTSTQYDIATQTVKVTNTISTINPFLNENFLLVGLILVILVGLGFFVFRNRKNNPQQKKHTETTFKLLCPSCAQKYLLEDHFCSNCGYRLKINQEYTGR